MTAHQGRRTGAAVWRVGAALAVALAAGLSSIAVVVATRSAATPETATPTSPPEPTVATITTYPPQPAALFYDAASGAEAYAHPGGLVVAGRDNFQDPVFEQVSAAGGSVLIYLD
ncbi:hypothetical protein ACI8AK_23185, partial [Geodermatophilus sp. SYSU D00867]